MIISDKALQNLNDSEIQSLLTDIEDELNFRSSHPLQNCPFCGGHNINYGRNTHDVSLECADCSTVMSYSMEKMDGITGIRIKPEEARIKLINKWNKRAIDKPGYDPKYGPTTQAFTFGAK